MDGQGEVPHTNIVRMYQLYLQLALGDIPALLRTALPTGLQASGSHYFGWFTVWPVAWKPRAY